MINYIVVAFRKWAISAWAIRTIVPWAEHSVFEFHVWIHCPLCVLLLLLLLTFKIAHAVQFHARYTLKSQWNPLSRLNYIENRLMLRDQLYHIFHHAVEPILVWIHFKFIWANPTIIWMMFLLNMSVQCSLNMPIPITITVNMF